jgi:very-short-patch-repair endonuclease
MRQCPRCGKAFKYTFEKKFCSVACANESFKRRIELVCRVCGRRYSTRAKNHDQKTCSRACRTEWIGKADSKLEQIIRIELEEVGLHPSPRIGLGPYTVDFAFLDQKVIVECDGQYWHSLPESIARDRRKDKFFANRGWLVVRLKEDEIMSSPRRCVSKVAQALSSRRKEHSK